MPGGVCAVLDYEVDLMAEYVAEMATRVVTPESQVTAAFRKFVSQILTSTRLPSTTILLGMNYLAKRINIMKQAGPYKATEGQVWRYLTVGLLLGSKFLDDNTFQNRSWSEVSGIAVSELNTLEYEWLTAIGWRLYVNLEESGDFTAWLDSWRDWQQMKKRDQARANRERLASLVPAIDTDLARYGGRNALPTFIQQQAAEFERYSSLRKNEVAQQPSYRSRDLAWSHTPWQAAPLTPPDSGYGTPEYVNSATSVSSRYNDWFSQQAATHMPYNQNANRYQQAPAQTSYYPRHNNYPGHYPYTGQGMWEHGIAECSCSNCLATTANKQPPYFMAHGFGQPVMG
jgi:hypothetical protein